MPLNFPTTGLTAGVTTYTFGGNTWIWNGYAWDSVVTPDSVGLTAYVRTWNGQTGNVTFSNYVTSVNGLTGAVTGIAGTGSNTFTGLQTMNAGITSANLFVSRGATFSNGIYVTGNSTVTGNLSAGSIDTNGIVINSGDLNLYSATTDEGAIISTNIFGNKITFTNEENSAVYKITAPTGCAAEVIMPCGGGVYTVATLNSSVQQFTSTQSFNAGISSSGLIVSGGATFNSNVIVNGNLTVSGGITSTFSENVLIEDNFILLNSNVTGGSPSENAGIEVSRGASANVQLRWNETTDNWQFTNDGTQFYDLPTSVVSSWNGSTGAVTFSNYVTSVNGSTGAVTNVAKTNTAQTFTALQDFSSGISAGSGVTFSSAYAGSFRTTTLRSDGTALQYIGDYSGVLGSGYFSVDNSSGVPVNRIAGTVYTDGIRAGGAVSVTGAISASTTITATGRMSNAGMTATGAVAFTSSVTANNLWVTNGVTFASTSVHTGLATFNAGVTANNLYISQGATFASNISAPNVVYSFNGNSGTVTYAPPLATSSVTGVASFGNEFVVSAAGAVSLTANYVKSFNGLTGTVTYATPLATSSVTGVASFGNEFVVSALGAVSLTANYVKSWNGSTGAVTFSNYVTSVNGSTGAISSIAVTGANTFTGLQTMNAGITANNLWVTNGATFAARSSFNSGLTASNLYVSAGATFAGGLNVSTITSNGTLTVSNAPNSIVRIGDYNGVGSGTYIELNDVANTIDLVGVVNTGTIYGTFYGDMHPTSIVRTYSIDSQTVTSTSTTGANQTICTITSAYDGTQIPALISPAIEATIVATDNTVANKNEILRMLITHDGTNTYNTQYGVVRTGAALATYTTTYSGTGLKDLLIRATPTSANSTSFIVTYTVYNR